MCDFTGVFSHLSKRHASLGAKWRRAVDFWASMGRKELPGCRHEFILRKRGDLGTFEILLPGISCQFSSDKLLHKFKTKPKKRGGGGRMTQWLRDQGTAEGIWALLSAWAQRTAFCQNLAPFNCWAWEEAKCSISCLHTVWFKISGDFISMFM